MAQTCQRHPGEGGAAVHVPTDSAADSSPPASPEQADAYHSAYLRWLGLLWSAHAKRLARAADQPEPHRLGLWDGEP